MSIKSAIDNLTGKSSKNIEDAISKMELGGGGTSVIVVTGLYDYVEHTLSSPSMTYEQMLSAYKAGAYLLLKMFNMPPEYGDQADWLHLLSYYDYGETENTMFCFETVKGRQDITVTCNINDTWQVQKTSL